MTHRPWPIVVLAFFHFFGPLINLAYGAWLLNARFVEFVPYYFAHTPPAEILTSFCLPWIAGICIYLLKEWSFVVFHAVMATILYQNYALFRDYPSVYPVSLLVMTYLFNIGLVSYFFLPAVRASFLNRRLRWWESLPRYEIKAPAIIEHANKRAKGKVTNLSQGGAFLVTSEKLKKDSEIRVAFTVCKQSNIVTAKVVHCRKEAPIGYGVQFDHTPLTKVSVRHVINTLVSEGIRPRQYRDREFFNELMLWGMTLMRTGKGWVPEIPVPPSEDREPSLNGPIFQPRYVERRRRPRSKRKTSKARLAA
jgi:uncharacterized membrane protein